MRNVVGGLSIWLGALAAAACANEPAKIGLVLHVPQGILDQADAVDLIVSVGAICNPATGKVVDEADAQTFPLDRCGPARWCKTVELEKDGIDRIFHVVAKQAGKVTGEGCVLKAVDQNPLDVPITVKKVVEKGCCNDGFVQPTEQCDNGLQAATDCQGKMPPGGNKACLAIQEDDVCDCGCLAKEIELSASQMGPPFVSNDPGSKTDLVMAFSAPNPTSPDVDGSLRAVFGDSTGTMQGEVNLRLLTSKLTQPMAPKLKNQLRLPLTCANVTGSGANRTQRMPSIAKVSADVVAVVYTQNEPMINAFNVVLSAQGPDGCANAGVVRVSVNEASCDWPDVAGGPEGQALVVWNQGGVLRGRIWKTSGEFVPPTADIDIGNISMGSKPHVAGSSTGWVVTYAGAGAGDGDGVFFKKIGLDGKVEGETKVNVLTDGVQDQPDVAMLADGRFAIAWQSGGKILFQRYDTAGMPRMGDQSTALTSASPTPASSPVIAAASKYFAAAWVAGNGTVWSRFMGGDGGFAINHVTGQNDDFNAVHPYYQNQAPRTRSGPAIAMNDSFVAIGWQDTSSEEHRGIVVRRFPRPE